MTTTDPEAPRPRRAFPRWLARLDPTLRGAETNALFLAFAERRQSVWSRMSWPLANLGWFLFAIVMMASFCCLAMPLIAVVPPLLRLSLGRRLHGSKGLPGRLSDVYSVWGTRTQPAVDLWMAPCSGAEVLECLYLEWRQARVMPVLLGSGLVTLPTLFVAFRAVHQYELRSLPLVLDQALLGFHLLAIAVFWVALVATLLARESVVGVRVTYYERFRYWGTMTTGTAWILAALSRFVGLLGGCFAAFAATVGFYILMGMLQETGLRMLNGGVLLSGIHAGFCLGLALVMVFVARPLYREKGQREFAEAAGVADQHYREYVRDRLLGDREGMTTAQAELLQVVKREIPGG